MGVQIQAFLAFVKLEVLGPLLGVEVGRAQVEDEGLGVEDPLKKSGQCCKTFSATFVA